ncbi:hypothetical protein N7537_005852 [Penicillium hordei]|uniref:Ankyrin repeat protein n=1 Tax=Penicillium hordei TaxID=40994 RepID=A0AAD6E6Y2_9EURO|nr:uncharacterized protein N7537_005852 [Penicillium hordei]KAJ5602896.1 hypothetical protein N7537_005852 [Penicillium hordei]
MSRGNLEVVKVLLSYGARINEEDNEERNTLMIAAKHKFNNTVISYLIKTGAKGDSGRLDAKRRVRRAQLWHNFTGKLKVGD